MGWTGGGIEMSLENRSSSALFKRAEQLRRWEESETNRETSVSKDKQRKIKFSADCVFLAACQAGDKEEIERLILQGADIDTANVDGLTALHQACIDDNLDMVEFLVEHGADVNRGDNEGWTPLHATASCGFISIAKYLMENGADVAAVNNDGELALDIAELDEMEELLQQQINAMNIDCEIARNKEQRIMLDDAKKWLNSGDFDEKPHSKSGATALHVAAAKGYINVMSVLLQAGADINAQDYDGWTPLHAAAHWAQKQACEILVENFCDMNLKNFVGQTAFDVADPEFLSALQELKSKQATMQQEQPQSQNILQSGVVPPRRRSSITRMTSSDKSQLITRDVSSERQVLKEEGGKDLRINSDIETESEKEEMATATEDSEVEKKNRVNRDEPAQILPSTDTAKTVPCPAPSSPPKAPLAESEDSSMPTWRRPASFRRRTGFEDQTRPHSISLRNADKEETAVKKPSPAPSPTSQSNITGESQDVVLRRTHSFESDQKFYARYAELRQRIKALSCPSLHPAHDVALPTRSASLKEGPLYRRNREEAKAASTKQDATSTPSSTKVPSSPTSASPTSLPGSQVRRSFVPPVRDEESETQRKAHAKRVRETRRSTQGVTLEELKSAEQLVKKKQQQQLQQATQQLQQKEQTSNPPSPSTAATIVSNTPAAVTTAAPTVTTPGQNAADDESFERRPSWRLRVDNGSRFLLEDARGKAASIAGVEATTTAYVRKPPTGGTSSNRPVSAPPDNSVETTVTLPLRRASRTADDKEQDKENDSRTAQATQAVIQRRRRAKRRSTGVVHMDVDDGSQPDDEAATEEGVDINSSAINSSQRLQLSGDRPTRPSRVTSSASAGGDPSTKADAASRLNRSSSTTSENGELDYKKLYETCLAENESLRDKLRKTQEELVDVKSQLDKNPTGVKSTLSEIEKRERRAMERKLSEMEEELKQLQKLKSENEKLKAENRALTRVMSKLTNSSK